MIGFSSGANAWKNVLPANLLIFFFTSCPRAYILFVGYSGKGIKML